MTHREGTLTICVMQFDTWDLAFNLAFAILWFRVFNQAPEGDFWNPYTAPLRRLTDTIISPLRPAFSALPASFMAAFLALIVLVSRALLCPRPPSAWTLHMGLMTGQIQTGALFSCFMASCFSAAIFLLKTWMIALLYLPAQREQESERARNALFVLTKPFSLLPTSLRLPALILAGGGTAFLAEQVLPAFGEMSSSCLVANNPLTATPLSMGLRALVIGLSMSVDAIGLLQQAIIFLLIGAWGGVVFGASGFTFFCREWIDLLLGPMRRHPVQLGTFDFTVILFIMLLFVIQIGITMVLFQALRALA